MSSMLRHKSEHSCTTASHVVQHEWPVIRHQKQNISTTIWKSLDFQQNIKFLISTISLKHITILLFSLFVLINCNAFFEYTEYNYYIPPLSEYQHIDIKSKILIIYESVIPSMTSNVQDNIIPKEKYLLDLMEKYGIHGLVHKVQCIAGKFVVKFPQHRFPNIPYCFIVDKLTCNNDSKPVRKEGESNYIMDNYIKIRKLLASQFSQKNYIKHDNKSVLIIFEQPSYYSETRALVKLTRCNEHQKFFSVIYVDWPVKHGPLYKTGFWPTVFGTSNKSECDRKSPSSSVSFYSPLAAKPEIAKWGIMSAPYVLQATLRSAVSHLREKTNEKAAPFTLINSWRSIEPSESLGFAFLEAIRYSQLSYHTSKSKNFAPVSSIGIFIHAFYIEIIHDIIEYLKVIQRKRQFVIELYVAVLPCNKAIVETVFSQLNWKVNIVTFENRGRDIFPFVATLPKLVERHNIIVKINTKKSIRNETKGDLWRNHSYKCLLQWNNFMKAVSALQNNASLGIIYPSNLVLPLRHFMRGTTEIFSKICLRMGFDPTKAIENLYFGAGTMFIARANALGLLANLAFPEFLFEVETGQIDRTLAHGIERAIAVSVNMSGYTIKETDCYSANVDFFLAELAGVEEFSTGSTASL